MWQQIITLLGGSALCLAAVAWLARSIIQHFLSRDIESYKTKLAAASDAEGERLKSDLQKIAFEHQVTFGKLHGDRAEVIKELNSRLVTLEDLVLKATKPFKNETEQSRLKEDVADILRLWNEFKEQFNRQRIFLSPQLCEKIHSFGVEIIDPLFLRRPLSGNATDKYEEWRERLDSLKQLRLDLESEFRAILGVK